MNPTINDLLIGVFRGEVSVDDLVGAMRNYQMKKLLASKVDEWLDSDITPPSRRPKLYEIALKLGSITHWDRILREETDADIVHLALNAYHLPEHSPAYLMWWLARNENILDRELWHTVNSLLDGILYMALDVPPYCGCPACRTDYGVFGPRSFPK